MPERVYYHVTFTVTRGKPVFLHDEIDAAFEALVREVAHRKRWALVALETMPNRVHLLLEKAPWEDLRTLIGHLKGYTAHELLARFDWLRGDLNSYYFWNHSFHYTRHTDASLDTALDTALAYIRNQRVAGGLADAPAPDRDKPDALP